MAEVIGPCRDSEVDERPRRDRDMRAEMILRESDIDERHAKRNPEELFKHTQWALAVVALGSKIDAGGTVILVGDRGNGKTQAAVELIRCSARRGKTCLYLRCREVGMRLRAAYDERGPSEAAALAELVSPWLLVIDECQERPDKDWEQRSLTLLMDKRYGACVPTILVANCEEKMLLDLLGPSIFDRAREGGGVKRFDWPSFRG